MARKRKPTVELRVMGRDYAVYVVTPRQMKKLAGEECAGLCDLHGRQIWLIPSPDMKQTLLHEIVEVLNFELELGLDHPKIKSLENALYQVFSDNRLVFHE